MRGEWLWTPTPAFLAAWRGLPNKEGMIPLWQPAIDEQTEVFVKGIVRNSADEYRCAVGAPCCTWPVPQGNPFCRIAREATILRLPVPS